MIIDDSPDTFSRTLLHAHLGSIFHLKKSHNVFPCVLWQVCSRSFVPNQPDSELKVWNVKTNVCVDLGDSHKFRGHVEQMDFTGPNGNLLIAATDGSQMSSYGEAVLWDWQSEKKLMSLTVRQECFSCLFLFHLCVFSSLTTVD